LLLALCGFLLAGAPEVKAQILSEELKSTVGFIFGRVHAKDQSGTIHEIDAALGTGFFVLWPDVRGGAGWAYCYFVTAKHVLRDTDKTFLRAIKIRLNLLSKDNERNFDHIDVPVSDEQGNLTWFQDPDDPSDEAVAFPFSPIKNVSSLKLFSIICL
jgi:hypothetical protein